MFGWSITLGALLLRGINGYVFSWSFEKTMLICRVCYSIACLIAVGIVAWIDQGSCLKGK
jgi:hypothetical protein